MQLVQICARSNADRLGSEGDHFNTAHWDRCADRRIKLLGCYSDVSTNSAIAPALKLEDPIEGQLRQWAESRSLRCQLTSDISSTASAIFFSMLVHQREELGNPAELLHRFHQLGEIVLTCFGSSPLSTRMAGGTEKRSSSRDLIGLVTISPLRAHGESQCTLKVS